MKKTIIYIVIAVLLAIGAYYLWQNRHDYFFQGEEPYEVEDQEGNGDYKKENGGDDNKENESEEDQDIEDGGDEDETNSSGDQQAGDGLQDILDNHCANRCENKKGTDDYDYCINICGLEESKQYVEDDCSLIESRFERDACYKQIAIEEKNAGICDQIEDKRLQKNCRDRVVEELFN